MSGYQGKVALVTGAGSGIGRAAARLYAARGAKVLAVDINAGAAEESVDLIRAAGGEARAFAADVTIGDQVEGAVDAAASAWGRLDVAFNNAGILGAFNVMLTDLTEADWDRSINVNLKSVWLCMKHQIPLIEKSGGGAIVNTASIAGLQAAPRAPAYGAAKHGVIGLTRAAAAQYASRGIRINAICPGLIETPLLHAQTPSPEFERFPPFFVPAGRKGSPAEIAEAVVWLTSDEAAYIVGVALAVDGGVVMK